MPLRKEKYADMENLLKPERNNGRDIIEKPQFTHQASGLLNRMKKY